MWTTEIEMRGDEPWVNLRCIGVIVAHMTLADWRALSVNQPTDEEQAPYDAGPGTHRGTLS